MHGIIHIRGQFHGVLFLRAIFAALEARLTPATPVASESHCSLNFAQLGDTERDRRPSLRVDPSFETLKRWLEMKSQARRETISQQPLLVPGAAHDFTNLLRLVNRVVPARHNIPQACRNGIIDVMHWRG